MRSSSEPSTQEVLAGLVERVTFHNAENGFCVLRAKARGHRDLVTVVGHAAIVSAGEWITASGEWINDRAHGHQFKARFLKTSARRCHVNLNWPREVVTTHFEFMRPSQLATSGTLRLGGREACGGR
jgi:hypothetical protein